jgi:hypothetical protein
VVTGVHRRRRLLVDLGKGDRVSAALPSTSQRLAF